MSWIGYSTTLRRSIPPSYRPLYAIKEMAGGNITCYWAIITHLLSGTCSHAFSANFPFRGTERSCTTAGQIFLKCWGFTFTCWLVFYSLVLMVLLPWLNFPFFLFLKVCGWCIREGSCHFRIPGKGKTSSWVECKNFLLTSTHTNTHIMPFFWWIIMFLI